MQLLSVVDGKRPIASAQGWASGRDFVNAQALDSMGFPWTAWRHAESGLVVVSAVEVPETQPGEIDLGPQYHLSISCRSQRASTAHVLWVLAQFDMLDGEEDNHVPFGVVRNFWRPVADHLSGYECPCKDQEPAIVEDKGEYVWRGITK